MPLEPSSEYTDPETERALLAALTQTPSLYWELDLPASVFHAHRDRYEALAAALDGETDPPRCPDDWAPAADPEAAAETLRDGSRRRRLARLLSEVAARLETDDAPSAARLLEDLEARAATIRGELQADDAGRLRYADDLVPRVLGRLERSRDRYQATGRSIRGVTSGIDRLDDILGGFQPGLSLLSGGPGVGKTSLAFQIAADAAESGTPALYVAFENSPEQLTLKGISATAGVNSQTVERGEHPLDELRPAAEAWRDRTRRLALIEGRGDLRIGPLRGKARRLMNRFGAQRCLIVVDYLQLYAKSAEHLQGMDVAARVELMGDQLGHLGKRLRSPVLAISSQTREGYGRGGGATTLDTLKESGDLEYMAEAVLFLTTSDERMVQPPGRAVDLTVSKNRHGEVGGIHLLFRPDLGTMELHGPRVRLQQ
jgi:replicative DNA helicase